jgi:hypothetical protein
MYKKKKANKYFVKSDKCKLLKNRAYSVFVSEFSIILFYNFTIAKTAGR